jgi:hypothetical protein
MYPFDIDIWRWLGDLQPAGRSIAQGFWQAVGADLWAVASFAAARIIAVIVAGAGILVLGGRRVWKGRNKPQNADESIDRGLMYIEVATFIAYFSLLNKNMQQEKRRADRWRQRALKAEAQIKAKELAALDKKRDSEPPTV